MSLVVCFALRATSGLWDMATAGQINNFMQAAMAAQTRGDKAVVLATLERVLEIEPHYAPGLLAWGSLHMAHPASQHLAFERLRLAFMPAAVPMPLTIESEKEYLLATITARFLYEQKQYHRSIGLLAQLVGDDMSVLGRSARFGHCLHLQLATGSLHPYQPTAAAARLASNRAGALGRALLRSPSLNLTLGGYDSVDQHNTCFLTPFYHGFHDQGAPSHAAQRVANRERLAQQTALMWHAWPALRYTAAHLPKQSCPVGRPVKLGVVSAFWHPGSVLSDFGGMLERLDRQKFEIGWVAVDEANQSSQWFNKQTGWRTTVGVGRGWLSVARREIAKQAFDILLYIDHTMSPKLQQLAMSRLAPVQAVSHGHFMTSGIPRDTMDYFISWAGAESAGAADAYTEQLVLLPADTIHQFYPMSDITTRLASTGASRADVAARIGVPELGTWYVCMQKPFKFDFRFYRILAKIISIDVDSVVVLHRADSADNHRWVVDGLSTAGVEVDRVHFVPVQPHAALIDLYKAADVLLDWYGCTTTREALGAGVPVVTLPGATLGEQWSRGYHELVGTAELVAADEAEFVRIATSVGHNATLRQGLRNRILHNVSVLWENGDAVHAWEQTLIRLLG